MNSASPGRWVCCILKIAFLMETWLLTPWIKVLPQFSHSVPQEDSSPWSLNHSISLTVLPLPLLTKREKYTALSAGRDWKGVYFLMILSNLNISPSASATRVADLRCRVGWLEYHHQFFNTKDTPGYLTASSPYHRQPCFLQLNRNTTLQKSQKTPCKEISPDYYYYYYYDTLYFNAKTRGSIWLITDSPKGKDPGSHNSTSGTETFRKNKCSAQWLNLHHPPLSLHALLEDSTDRVTVPTGGHFILKSAQLPSNMKTSIKRKVPSALTGSHGQRRIVT